MIKEFTTNLHIRPDMGTSFVDSSCSLMHSLEEPEPLLWVFLSGFYRQIRNPWLFEFYNASKDPRISGKKVFLRDHFRAWFNLGVMGVTNSIQDTANLLMMVAKHEKVKEVRLVGGSMGAFGALAIGSFMLNKGLTISVRAFNPQTLIAKGGSIQLVPEDRRKFLRAGAWTVPSWRGVFDLTKALPKSCSDFIVYFSENSPSDVRHVSRLTGTVNIPIDYNRHRVLKYLKDEGLLVDFLL